MTSRYLDDLRRELRRLAPDERDDAVREIGSHIADAEAAGQPTVAVLGRLGPAKTLARAYIADAYLQSPGAMARSRQMMGIAAFVMGSGMVSLFVVPVLALLVGTLGLSALSIPVVGILQILGFVADENGIMYWGEPVAKVWVLPLTLAVSLLCGGLAWGAYRALRAYAFGVLAGYRRVLSAFQS
jgi:uncharacterized membrane protein